MGRRSLSRQALTAVVVVSVAAIVGTAAALAASSSGTGGSFRVFGVSNGIGAGGDVLLTGAIGDHGRNESVTKSGKVSQNGSYVELKLSRGTMILNKTALDKAVGKAFNGAVPNRATCSLSAVASGRLPFVSGTGRYAGVKGSVHITVAAGFIFPRKGGKCDTRGAPTASRQIVYGTGSASF
jgi:hypothetical protein